MKIKKLITLIITTMLVVSCSSSDVDLAKKINNDESMVGQQVELSGKINTKFQRFFSGQAETWTVNFDVSNSLNNKQNEMVRVKFNYAKGTPNSIFIDIPEGESNYKSSDLKIYDKNGKESTSVNKIKIKGTVSKENESIIIKDVIIEE